MSRKHTSSSALAALAKQHLGLPSTTPDVRVPKFYLEELRRHVAMYPQEDQLYEPQFRVTLEPKLGFGSVTCLKGGCNAEITLIQRVSAPDGGKKDGLGSLSAYRNHISSSHAPKRLHIKAEPFEPSLILTDPPHPPAGAVKMESSDSSLPTSSSIIFTPSSSSHSNLEEHKPPLLRIKPEAIEVRIPRKRLSDIAFGADRSATTNASRAGAVAYIPSKKVKKEEPPTKVPLAQVTNTPIASGSRSSPDMNSFDAAYGDPENMLDNVRVAIFGQENLLYNIRCKASLGSEDFMMMKQYEDELERLRILEQECVQRVTSAYPGPSVVQQTQRPITVKAEPVDIHYPSPQMYNAYTTSRTPPAPHPVLMDFDLDSWSEFSSQQSNSSSPVYPYNLPGTSAVKSEPLKKDPFARSSSPVASGSAPFLPYHADDIKPAVDVEMNSPYVSEEDSEGGLHIENENAFIAQVGINVPAIYNDAHDSNGDYHGRGRDLFVGPLAGADDIEKFLVEAGNAESFDGNESVEKALKYLGLTCLQQKLPGMEISLMPHQIMGVAWMIEKERGSLKGGCLADEMGLGKVCVVMATLVHNRSTNPKCKTNLIIAPLALLNQWKLEIETKTNLDLKCLIYHGPSRTRRKSELMEYDVVLTTFHTMAHEWPDYEKQMKKKAKAKKKGEAFIVESDDDDMCNHTYRSDKRKQQAGILFQVEVNTFLKYPLHILTLSQFYRIIADEGQNIRNRRTRMSRAITDLQGVYRWCLTGTPIVNSLADVYGLIRFLKLRPWYDWTHFQSKIGVLEKRNPGLAVARLQKVMVLFLLRRKKDSKLDGKNLIELPEKRVELVKLEFSEEEKEIYNMVEARSQAKFNRYLRAGTVLKNYHQVLVLLLRLRQVCSHPSLIQEDGVAFVNPDEADVKPEFSTELTRARRLVSPEFVAKMKERFLQDALARIEAEKNSADATIEEEDCPICYDAMTEAIVTACTHCFCRECFGPVCRTPITENMLFSRQAFEPSDEELNPEAANKEEEQIEERDVEEYVLKNNKGKGKAPARSRRSTRRAVADSDDDGDDVLKSDSEDDNGNDDDDMSDFIVESDEDEEEKDARLALKKRLGKRKAHVILDSDEEPETPEEKEIIFGARKKHVSKEAIKLLPRFLPSSKMKYMMDQLQNLAKTHPEEKTLLVSQWTGCLSLISDYLTEKGIPHVKYQGDMSRTKRDQAVQIFMSREKARVMLMSLKCGGVGLNLTRANNVISLDLGWSQAVESQAFDRVHRVGQERKVLVQRVVIADTVEDRILQMQERKQTLADGSLGEGAGKKMGTNLFGLDARGRLLMTH
ncbi:hypothetical protein CVT25_007147 [Psilocybe cyanescens]|uniref:Uncharacterized protein n=1 Tax=Psilocybe cyanescens TaxID=93625 RepID=A0A409WVJ0_PSICY|nr:hypothetical protein CVT25_007147 [Psilocybe cyanescens]